MTKPRPADFIPATIGPNWASLPLPAVILDARGRVAAMNDLAEPFLNVSARSMLGRVLADDGKEARLRILPPLGLLLERASDGHEALSLSGVRFEIGDRAGGYTTRFATIHAGPVPSPEGGTMILIAPTDAAERLEQGRAARTAARSAIGMAEMLAHEIKNPLAGIRGAAQLIAMNLSPEDRDLTDLIVTESRRIVALLEQVEQFGDTRPPDLQPVNIHDVLERARRSAQVGFAQDVRIVAEYDPSLPLALADADQLVQVCLNLLKNAAEAMASDDNPAPVLRIHTFYDNTLRLAATDAEPAGCPLPLQIEIEDNGPGIPEQLSGQIFDPFVSGRENGTGLGLALVSKIITGHGALIRVDSRPGRTVFRISLPKA